MALPLSGSVSFSGSPPRFPVGPASAVESNVINSIDGSDGSTGGIGVTVPPGSGVATVFIYFDPTAPRVVTSGVRSGPPTYNCNLVKAPTGDIGLSVSGVVPGGAGTSSGNSPVSSTAISSPPVEMSLATT